MKKLTILFILIFSFLLTSCENNNEENNNKNFSRNITNENATQTPNVQKRLSYEEYVEEYDINTNPTDEDADTENNSRPLEEKNALEAPSADTPNLLASFSTSLLSSSSERVNNLNIVCDRLNNFILYPNETFSYNNVAGPYGPDDGFEEAPILLSDGTKTEGYGGGVCQLSSTLYNVVKNIDNIEITERHNHSTPVSYVPSGEDATVSLQSGLDFKFINTNNFPIRFEAKCENWKISVWAYKEV